MTTRSTMSVAIVAIALVLVGCGGGQQTPTSAGTNPPGQTGAPPTAAPPVAGEPIDTAQVQAAVDTLLEQESWRFEASTITMGLESGVRNTISGIQRTQPEPAVDAQHFQDEGEPFRYVRIGDDIWYDVGTGQFTQVSAADAENLIEQYEPYYLQGLAESATSQGWTWEPAGTEVVNTIATMHYRISEADLEDIVQLTELTPDQWGGDAWIATDGGYLVQLAWGPQRPADAQISTGFIYDVADVNCECPIEPPTGSATGGSDPY